MDSSLDRYSRYTNELMRVHVTWITPPWVKERPDFDAKTWVRQFRSAGIDNILFYAKFHDGNCMWPSKYREIKPERDFVGEITEEAAKAGLNVSLYYSFGPDRWTTAAHPEWACLDERGNVAIDHFASIDWTYGCINSGYREFMLGQIQELLANYDITGIWLDLFTFPMRKGCFCDHCQQAFSRWSGGKTLLEAAGTLEHKIFLRECLKKVLLEIKEIANAAGVRRPVSFNGSGGTWIYGWKDSKVFRPLDEYVDYLSIEGFGGADPRNISFNLRLARSDGKPFESISTVSDDAVGRGWALRNTDLLILEGATITAHGGTYMSCIETTPSGHNFECQVEQVAEVKRYLDDRSEFLKETEPVYDALIWGNKTRNGWGTALFQRHIPFGFLYHDSDCGSRPLVIVDGTYTVDRDAQARLVEYVENGGKLIIEYSGAAFNTDADDRYLEMLGVKYICESGYDIHYLGGFEEALGHGMPDYPLLIEGPAYKIKSVTAKVLATYHYPIASFSRDRSAFHRRHAPRLENSGDAAITMNRYGKGQVVYVGCALGTGELGAVSIEGSGEGTGSGPYAKLIGAYPKQLVDNLVTLVLGEENRSVKTSAPPGVEVVVNKQGSRYIVHLLNHYLVPTLFYDTVRGAMELGNIRLEINEKKTGKIADVYRVMGDRGEELCTDRDGDWLCVHVPRLSVHEMIVLNAHG